MNTPKTITEVTTADHKVFTSDTDKLIGSVSKVRGRDVHKPAVVGEFPVFVEQSGNFRIFTYNRKIVSFSERPLAAPGLKSYRARGPFGWIMIGATDHADARKQAYRSTDTVHELQEWNGQEYVSVSAPQARSAA